jgi:hypothetical protein
MELREATQSAKGRRQTSGIGRKIKENLINFHLDCG